MGGFRRKKIMAASDEGFPAWDSFVDGLRELGPKMLDKLPPSLRADPQAQQEIGRLTLGARARRTMETISPYGGRPMFLPSLNLTMNIFQPKADTTYRTAFITQ